jgi:hypothetical protein
VLSFTNLLFTGRDLDFQQFHILKVRETTRLMVNKTHTPTPTPTHTAPQTNSMKKERKRKRKKKHLFY